MAPESLNELLEYFKRTIKCAKSGMDVLKNLNESTTSLFYRNIELAIDYLSYISQTNADTSSFDWNISVEELEDPEFSHVLDSIPNSEYKFSLVVPCQSLKGEIRRKAFASIVNMFAEKLKNNFIFRESISKNYCILCLFWVINNNHANKP